MSKTYSASATYEWGAPVSGVTGGQPTSDGVESSSSIKSTSHTSIYLPAYLLGSASPDPLKTLPPTSSSSKNTPPSFFRNGRSNTSHGQASLERRAFSPFKDTISIDSLNQMIASSSSSFIETVPATGLLGSPPKESLSDYVMRTPCTPTSSSGEIGNIIFAASQSTPSKNGSFSNCTMTTIFGFPPTELDVVISYFKTIGTVKFIKSLNIETKPNNFRDPFDNCSAGPSWIHVEWASSLDASKALEKQGTLMLATLPDGTDVQYMLGVVPFDIARAKLNSVCAEDVIWSCSPVKPKRPDSSSIQSQVPENIFLDHKQEQSGRPLLPLDGQTRGLGYYFDNFLNWLFGV